MYRFILDVYKRQIYEDSSTKEVTYTITGEVQVAEEEEEEELEDVWSAFELEDEAEDCLLYTS